MFARRHQKGSSFDFTPDNAAEMRAVLEPMVQKFHANVETIIQISMVYCKKIYYHKSLVVHYPNKCFMTRSWQLYFNTFVNKESSLS